MKQSVAPVSENKT